ncbi:hypothetical protein B0H14DRAFT_3501693 [Mycena olivaceomarginata]|nr:hypothetical protein B0H14DRAFT_3501693 [Mycena olivaceomarginata]
MAAWNYRCILLCAIPVVKGLLPEPFNNEVLDDLFALAEWHSFGRLKLHTESTLGLFRIANRELGRLLRELGRLLRRFQRECHTAAVPILAANALIAAADTADVVHVHALAFSNSLSGLLHPDPAPPRFDLPILCALANEHELITHILQI